MKRLTRYHRMVGLLAVALLILASTVSASSGGVYTLDWFRVSGGSETIGSGGFSLTSTIGQAEAGASSGASYSLTGGFLAGAVGGYKIYLPLILKNS